MLGTKNLHFHDLGILGRVQPAQNQYYLSLETPGHLNKIKKHLWDILLKNLLVVNQGIKYELLLIIVILLSASGNPSSGNSSLENHMDTNFCSPLNTIDPVLMMSRFVYCTTEVLSLVTAFGVPFFCKVVNKL